MMTLTLTSVPDVLGYSAELIRHLLSYLGLNTVYSMILAALLIIVVRVFRIGSPAVLQACWSLVLVRLLLPPGLSSALSLRAAVDAVLQLFLRLAPVAPSGEAAINADGLILAATGANAGTAGLQWGWPLLLAALWAVGAGLLLFVFSFQLTRFRRLARVAAEVQEPALAEVVERWRRRLGVRRQVRLVCSEACLSPFTTGVVRPLIHLPRVLTDWPVRSLEPVIAHEMVHIRRLDAFWIVVLNLVRALFFFNPAAWVAVSRLAQSREQLCDQVVLAGGGIAPRDYGRSLLNILRLNVFGTATADAVAGLIERKEGVEMRLAAILVKPAVKHPKASRALLIGLVCGLFVLPMAAFAPQVAAFAGGTERATDPARQALIAPPAMPATTIAAALVAGDNEEDEEVHRFRSDGPITEPVAVFKPMPVYPIEARAEGVSGVVVLETTLSAEGRVTDVKVLRSADDRLADAAVDAVRQWTFEPATLDGEPVAVWYVLTVRFNLDGECGEESAEQEG